MWFDIIRKGSAYKVVLKIIPIVEELKEDVKDLPLQYRKEFQETVDEYYRQLTEPEYRGDAYSDPVMYDEIKVTNEFQPKLISLYNKIPKKFKTPSIYAKSSEALAKINKKLNKINSLLQTSDFEFNPDKKSRGEYRYRDDKGVAFLNPKSDIDDIISTLVHESGHMTSYDLARLSSDLKFVYGKHFNLFNPESDSFYEEMMAYLIQYPNDRNKALREWAMHFNVLDEVEKDPKKKEIYDKIVEEVYGEEAFLTQYPDDRTKALREWAIYDEILEEGYGEDD